MQRLQFFFCQSCYLHDLRPRHSHSQQVTRYSQTFRQFTFCTTFSNSLFLAFNIRAIKAGVVIIGGLNTFIVFFLLLTTQATNIRQFRKMIKYLLLCRKRQSFQYFHILQNINPFFKTCLAFFLTLIKERKRKIDETIHKEGYPSVLHLNDKMLAIVGYTIDIKDAATEIIRFSRQFLILSAAVNDSPTILLFPSP